MQKPKIFKMNTNLAERSTVKIVCVELPCVYPVFWTLVGFYNQSLSCPIFSKARHIVVANLAELERFTIECSYGNKCA
jgi:hypothetical protein